MITHKKVRLCRKNVLFYFIFYFANRQALLHIWRRFLPIYHKCARFFSPFPPFAAARVGRQMHSARRAAGGHTKQEDGERQPPVRKGPRRNLRRGPLLPLFRKREADALIRQTQWYTPSLPEPIPRSHSPRVPLKLSEVRAGQFWKAAPLIFFSPAGSVTERREVQPLKAYSYRFCSPTGKVTETSEVQFLKARLEMS